MKTITPISVQRIIVILCLFALGNTYGQVKNPSNKILFGKHVQTENVNPKTGDIRCATTEYEQFLQEKNPKRMTDAQFETWITPLVKKQKEMRIASKTAATIIVIPVVVHVIHNGQAVGTAPNISDAQVESQITVLNEDFRKMLGSNGYNSSLVGADVEIEFKLALQDPNGNPTNGIDRVNFGQSTWSFDDIEATVKPATSWNPSLYLNMWTITFSNSNNLGYAQFPNASGGLPGLFTYGGAANTDGVVSGYSVFGSRDHPDGSTFTLDATYNLGRTMTHEVGHWLGLKHIWGDVKCGDDFCDDTPVHHKENFGCPQTILDCNSVGYEMVQNYMDYTDDSCMNIFTQNQKDRITVIMNNAARRSSLKTSTKADAIPLFANDAEVKIEAANYIIDTQNATCATPPASNKSVALYNRGTSTITAIPLNYTMNSGANQTYTWNGSLAPNKSVIVTLPNTVAYGTLNVYFVSTNLGTDLGTSNNSAVETFTSPSLPTNYTIKNYTFTLQQDFFGSETTWSLKNSAGIPLYSGGPYTDEATLPAIITENWVLASNQCYTFTIDDSQGDGICCGIDNGDGYFDIKSTDGSITVLAGSNFGYVDTKSFTTNSLETNEFETSTDIYLYPNPTKGTLNINIPSAFGLPNSYVISNALGQIISQKNISKESDLTLNTLALNNGIYFITIVKEDHKRTLQFIKE